jgi:Lrp/AsnC family leucine-responsive transcriptional regulator
MNQLDRHDVLLLAELQRDSRQTVQQLATTVGLSSTPCWKRVKEMEAAGIIRGYTALVDREKVGLSLCVLAEVNLTRHNEDDVRRFEQAVAEAPQIVSCYATTGQADYVIKVLVPDIKSYEAFLHETAFKLPGVTHVRSSVVLKEVKAETRLPLEDQTSPPPKRRSAGRR